MSWEDNTRRVDPYVPGEQPAGEDIIKLNTNENPYPPSPAVGRVLKAFDSSILRKYPDPSASDLIHALADEYGVDAAQVFVGVGSDDVLALSFLTFFNGTAPVLFADITYSFYPVWCSLFRINYEQIPLDEDFSIVTADYFRDNGGIVIANPNAPTGKAMKLSNIEEIVKNNPDSVCIIDEAYIDFGGESALSLIDSYDNLIVIRTFSKSRSLAGSRIGFALADKNLISCLNDVKFSFNSYTMDSITQAVGVAALLDKEYFSDTIRRIISTREWSIDSFRRLGFSVINSSANFLFVTHPTYPADELFAMLRERKVYVRYFASPGIDNYLRVTIGTDEQMKRLFEILEEYMG